MDFISKGFMPKRKQDDRLPPGQYEVKNFPVLSLGPTPNVSIADWRLDILGLADKMSWNWEEFNVLPHITITDDIHCVTKWSKFGTKWTGVSLDEIMQRAHIKPEATHVIAHSHDGYSTNLPLEDVQEGKGMVAIAFEDKPIPAEHGGPARLLVPHLYFWKSAKWLKALEFTNKDHPGFWETRGYHNYGDPWKDQRYTND